MLIHKFPCVRQDEKKDCGIASLATIIKSYKGNIPNSKLKEWVSVTKEGTTAYALIQVASKIGLEGKGIKGPYEELTNDTLPCIAHVITKERRTHFVVIHEINKRKKYLIVADPARGLIRMPNSDFEKIKTDRYLCFKPVKPLPYYLEEPYLLPYLSAIIKEEWRTLGTLLGLSIIITGIGIVLSFFFKIMLEWGIVGESRENLISIGCTFLILTLFYHRSQSLKNRLVFPFAQKINNKLMEKVYQQIVLLPFSFYKNKTTGEVVARLQDASIVGSFLLKLGNVLFMDVPLLIASSFIIGVLSPIFLFFFLFFLSIFIMVVLLFKKTEEKEITRERIEEGVFSSFLTESLTYLASIKHLHLEEKKMDDFQEKLEDLKIKQKNIHHVQTRRFFWTSTLKKWSEIVILCLGAHLCLEKKMTIGKLITLQSIYSYLFIAIENIALLLFDVSSFKVTVKRLDEFFQIKRENFSLNYQYQHLSLNEDIEISHLQFSHNDIEPCLKDINLKIPKGIRLLLYGESGSGKSTLVKLLLRYYPVKPNQIWIGKRDVNLYHLENIRDRITYVSQKEGLFTGTVYQNITLDREISYDEFLNVCQLMKVDAIVKNSTVLYEKEIEENGNNLSGGERQRIILARALLKESDIYIFDESLNELDVTMERLILKNIFTYLKGKTIIVISHRFHNQDLFTKKIKLEKGRIVHDHVYISKKLQEENSRRKATSPC